MRRRDDVRCRPGRAASPEEKRMIAMLRKFVVVPSVVGILGIAYLVMCLLAFPLRGRRWPLEKKLAIGCLLISLNAASPASGRRHASR
jgi:hypothetical protein